MTSGPAEQRATFNWRRRFSSVTTPQQNPRRALGKGLGALLPTRLPSAAAPAPTMSPAGPEHANSIAIDQIDPNPVQPRRGVQTEPTNKLVHAAPARRTSQ